MIPHTEQSPWLIGNTKILLLVSNKIVLLSPFSYYHTPFWHSRSSNFITLTPWRKMLSLYFCYSRIVHALGTSLVAQWLRICLPVQRTWVQSLVREDPTCHGATKPQLLSLHSRATSHNYWSSRAIELMCCNYWAHALQLLKPTHLEPMLHNKGSHRNEKPICTATKSSPCSPQLEKVLAQQRRPNAAKK